MALKNLRFSSVDAITLKVSQVAQMTEQEQDDLIRVFNEYGCVLLVCDPTSDLKSNLVDLQPLLGSPIYHRHSETDGIVTVVNSDGAAYQGLTGQQFKFHTDGSFLEDPPKVFALQCEVASRNGGYSQLVQAELLYDYLLKHDPEGLKALQEPDAITITDVDQSIMTRRIFTQSQGRVMMAYRSSDSQLTITPKPAARNAFQLIQDYAESLENQFLFKLEAHQIIIADNTRILHGRTPVPADEFPKRKLNRLWFDGRSSSSGRLSFGFLI